MNNQNAAPNVDYIDYLKLRAIEDSARQYWLNVPIGDADYRSAQGDYQYAKDQADQWYADHKQEIDSAT